MPGQAAIVDPETMELQQRVYGAKTTVAPLEQISDRRVLRAIVESEGFGKDRIPAGHTGFSKAVVVHQNERRKPKSGSWSDDLLTNGDPPALCNSDGAGRYNFAIDRHPKIHCPVKWHWADDWHLPGKRDNDESADKDGWQYALDWDSTFGSVALMTSCVRRRVWARTVADQAAESQVAVRPSSKASKAAHCSDRIAAGHDHFLVLGIDGDVYSFGDNSHAQCMQVGGAGINKPMRVPNLFMRRVLQVECGDFHSLVLIADGSVHAAGDNSHGQCGVEHRDECEQGFCIESLSGRRVVRVAAGAQHSLFLTARGNVLACGDNSAGQLAAGAGKKHSRLPRLIKGEWIGKDSAESFEMIMAGSQTSCAVTKSGNCYTWGSNVSGALGRKGTIFSALIVQTFVKAGVKIHEVSIGSGSNPHSVFIDHMAQLWTCGGYTGGKNGHQCPDECDLWQPKMVTGIPFVIQCSAGASSTLCVTSDYTVIGSGDVTGTNTFCSIPTESPILEVQVGGNRCVALSSEGQIFVINNGPQVISLQGNTYTGEAEREEFDIYDIRREGKGSLYFLDGATFSGDFLNNMMHGEGTYTNANGDSFTGYWWRGERSGQMQVQYANGDTYAGTFQGWKMDGQGHWISHLGDSYDGEWKDGKWHGHGKHIYEDGAVYEGNFKNGIREGDGRYEWHHGQVYEGQYKNDKISGFGYLRTSQGNEYYGQMEDSTCSGKGMYRYNEDGNVYYGEWQNNTRHGNGLFVETDGSTYRGGFSEHLKDTRDQITGEHEVAYLRRPNGDTFAVMFEEGDEVAHDPVDSKRLQLEDAINDDEFKAQEEASLEEEYKQRAELEKESMALESELEVKESEASVANQEAIKASRLLENDLKVRLAQFERDSNQRMEEIIHLEHDLSEHKEQHNVPKQEEVAGLLESKRMEHRMISQAAVKERSDLEKELAQAEKVEREQRDRKSVMAMERARAEEECDIKTKKARQVKMALTRCREERHRLGLKIDMLTAWIEEDKNRAQASEEATYRDFALDRQEHIHLEVERREETIAERTLCLEESDDKKSKANDQRESSAGHVAEFAAKVQECRAETRKVHDDELEEKLVQLKKDLEDATDELEYADKEHDRIKVYHRFSELALERAIDRKKAAVRRMQTAADEAAASDEKYKVLMDKAQELEYVRRGKLAELEFAEDEPLTEIPEVRETVLETKVMVGRTQGQKLWGRLQNTVRAVNAFKNAGSDPANLSQEEQLHSLEEVVGEELERVQRELELCELDDASNISAKRWRLKYKYKYYYKYKARAEEEAGVQQAQVLGQTWDLDPAVADMESPMYLPAPEPDFNGQHTGPTEMPPPMSPARALPDSPSNHAMDLSYAPTSPPQLGRGDLDFVDSPAEFGEQGPAEFMVYVAELEHEQVHAVEMASRRQAAACLQELHSTGLQEKQYREKTVPMQRGMRKETEAWQNLIAIMNDRGVEEVKEALTVREVTTLTSKNIRAAVRYLAKVLNVPLMTKQSPAKGPMDLIRESLPWDSSVTPAGREKYLKRLQTANNSSPTANNPHAAELALLRTQALQSPEKLGWDHERSRKVDMLHYKMGH